MKDIALEWWNLASDDDKRYYSEIHYQLPFSQLTEDEIEWIYIYEVVDRSYRIGKQLDEYMLQYKGNPYYNDIIQAVAFGWELCENN